MPLTFCIAAAPLITVAPACVGIPGGRAGPPGRRCACLSCRGHGNAGRGDRPQGELHGPGLPGARGLPGREMPVGLAGGKRYRVLSLTCVGWQAGLSHPLGSRRGIVYVAQARHVGISRARWAPGSAGRPRFRGVPGLLAGARRMALPEERRGREQARHGT
jgi:hypothetical protein